MPKIYIESTYADDVKQHPEFLELLTNRTIDLQRFIKSLNETYGEKHIVTVTEDGIHVTQDVLEVDVTELHL